MPAALNLARLPRLGPRALLELSLAVGALASCGAPDAPADPTWADVHPILQGQCLHCHGATAAGDGAGVRFDLLDAASLCAQGPEDELGARLSPAPSFLRNAMSLLETIRPPANRPGGRPKMPPAPATPLEPWQRETLERYVAKLLALPAGERATTGRGPIPKDARPPRLRVARYAVLGPRVVIDYVVEDDNADSVIGELRLGPAVAPIPAGGAGQVALDVTGVPPGPLQLTARLCDGWGVKLRGAADGLPLIDR
ncbi:MAG: hypothetical protein QN159_10940 [Armatimonadota bacterium]|nr:hypothetical protein [Armatimonadota bacterium]